jgi:hypothetical protein
LGQKNLIQDLITYHREDPGNLDDSQLDAHLFFFRIVDDYFTDIVQFFSTGVAPHEFTVVQKKQLVMKEAYYQLIEGNS